MRQGPEVPAGIDVLLAGDVFADLVFTGLRSAPRPGTETWSTGFAIAPGGIANMGVALARLGLRPAMSAVFGDDLFGVWTWDCLEQEGVDLSSSRRIGGGRTAVTASLVYDGDRAMVTYDEQAVVDVDAMIPADSHPSAAILYLGSRAAAGQWWRTAARSGTRVFADVAWDPSQKWDTALLDDLDACHAFLPNEAEARAYTRTDSATRAAAALAERVPVVAVTRGADGAVAVDQTTGETADVPGVPVDVVDTTGAGDVFVAAFTAASGWDLPLVHRVELSVLCSSLSVREPTGSLGAPSLRSLADWWSTTVTRAAAGEFRAQDLRRRFGFLDDLEPVTVLAAPHAR
ncbi:carbohydrate kinase family protein [Kineosporiaceae bacterium SCSIO 59966]|nr:carbohydrate kinase family protein [Kineosporiaceae bacterium SCSIO 59966]